MDASWWSFLDVKCSKCEAVSFQLQTHFSSDGQIRFRYFCPDCKVEFSVDYSASQLQSIAFGLDRKKDCAKCGEQKASCATPPSPHVVLTNDDLELLRELKINPEEGVWKSEPSADVEK